MAKAMLFQNELGSGVIQNALKTMIGRKNAQVLACAWMKRNLKVTSLGRSGLWGDRRERSGHRWRGKA